MNDQIERLKKNMKRISRMTQGDLLFLKSIPLDFIVFLGWSSGTWDGAISSYDFVPEGIYRIHHSYTPEPDKPVFEGYVLCEVKKDEEGNWVFEDWSGLWTYLDHAPRFGCCGYVFKENTSEMWDAPVKFAKGKHLSSIHSGDMSFKPATLAFVCFKEDGE